MTPSRFSGVQDQKSRTLLKRKPRADTRSPASKIRPGAALSRAPPVKGKCIRVSSTLNRLVIVTQHVATSQTIFSCGSFVVSIEDHPSCS